MSIAKRDRQAVMSKGDREAIDNRQRAVRLARRPLEYFLRQVKSELGLAEAGLTVRLVSDREIARMNETFRKKKGPTDVLSFPMVVRRRPVPLSSVCGHWCAGIPACADWPRRSRRARLCANCRSSRLYSRRR